MTFKVQGVASDGETFYADGSPNGKRFATVEDAISYAHDYARTVGEVSCDPSPTPGCCFVATKPDGYSERIRVIEA